MSAKSQAAIAQAVRIVGRSGPVRSMNSRLSPTFTPPMRAELITGGNVSTSPLPSDRSGNFANCDTRCPYSFPLGWAERISLMLRGLSKSSGTNRVASGSAAP